MIEMAPSYFFPIMELLKIPHDFFNEMTKSTIALFVVIDPIGNVPLFIALTSKMDKNQKKKTSKVAIVTAAFLTKHICCGWYTDTVDIRNQHI